MANRTRSKQKSRGEGSNKGDKGSTGSFNQPFKQQLKAKKASLIPPADAKAPSHSVKRDPAPEPQAKNGSSKSAIEQEQELFLQAMAGVNPITDPHGTVPPPEPHKTSVVVSEDAETLARLAELVSGEGDFDIADTDEHIEGAAPGVNNRLLASLRKGDYSVQGHVDLHGLTKPEAKEAVDRFITQARRDGKRCVLIVHGRGLNSKDQIPVLKEQMKVWLTRGHIARSVLAFCSARPHDGGLGALYVLLRK